MKTKDTEELTEAVEITEDIDPEQEFEEEVSSRISIRLAHIDRLYAARKAQF